MSDSALESGSEEYPQQHGLQKVCVIGTSNGVFRDGYVKALKESALFSAVDNYSVGACATELFVFRRTMFDLSSYDICVLELGCNEGWWVTNGENNADHVRDALLNAVVEVLKAGVIPALLLLPITPVLPDGGSIRQIYEDVSDKLGVLLFDCYHVLCEFERAGFRIAELFDDNVHLRRDVAREIGSAFATTLVASLTSPLELRTLELCVSTYTFSPAERLGVLPTQIEVKKTAAMLCKVAHCSDTDILEIHLREGCRFVAAVLDMSISCSVMEIRGTIVQRIRLMSTSFSDRNPSLRATVIPTYRVCGENGSVVVRFLPDGPAPFQFVSSTDYIPRPVSAGLIGFVIAGQDTIERISVPFRLERQLHLMLQPSWYDHVRSQTRFTVELQIVGAVYHALLWRNVDPLGASRYTELLQKTSVVEGTTEIIRSVMASEEYRLRWGDGLPTIYDLVTIPKHSPFDAFARPSTLVGLEEAGTVAGL